ncbi:MAG TPA: hypothetical protein VF457_19390 [Burkholderiaceae bacterium]
MRFPYNLFAKASPKVDLEDLIYEIAEHQRDVDFKTLYREMNKREVFVPIVRASLPPGAQPGESITSSASAPIQIRFVSGPNGAPLVPCATQRDVSLLKDGYAGMPWDGFLEMVLKVDPSFYGALLQGRRSWIVFDRQRVQHILDLMS